MRLKVRFMDAHGAVAAETILNNIAKSSSVKQLIDRIITDDKYPFADVDDGVHLRLIAKGKILHEKAHDKDCYLYVNYDIKEDEVGWSEMLQRGECKAFKSFLVVQVYRKSDRGGGEGEKETDKLIESDIDDEMELEEANGATDTTNDNDDDVGGDLMCDKCKADRLCICRICNCNKCGSPENTHQTLVCDGYFDGGLCPNRFHIYCLPIPLDNIPRGDWYCPECAADYQRRKSITVGKEATITERKKKSKAADARGKHWGGGVSCAGVANKTNRNKFGRIAGYEVGQTWQYRVDLSSSGIHCPPVSGIHGSKVGAFSIVVSGGYEDDSDKGNTLTYTGQGGRDLSGNKRCNVQSCDQTLTQGNYGLALSCYPFKPNENGGDAGDKWKQSKPIRVVRGGNKPRKRNADAKYMPDKGFRYDGIYRVTKYYKEKGKEGFDVWKFVLQRDDDVPAPWTTEGKKRIAKLNLQMIMSDATKAAVDEKSNRKRPRDDDAENSTGVNVRAFTQQFLSAVAADIANKNAWDRALAKHDHNVASFKTAVENELRCCICLDLPYQDPVTTACAHILCIDCIQRMDGNDRCPVCRMPIAALDVVINGMLKSALSLIYDNRHLQA